VLPAPWARAAFTLSTAGTAVWEGALAKEARNSTARQPGRNNNLVIVVNCKKGRRTEKAPLQSWEQNHC
jgi:hypothetical protein